MELIKTWRKDGFTLRMWNTWRTDSTNHTKLRYELKDGRKVIFSGDDYGVPSCTAIDSLEAVASLLGFLSLKEGDTDSEYFANYTPEQIAWRDSSRCEHLGMIQFEMEERADRRRKR